MKQKQNIIETKYQLLINKCEIIGLEHFNNPKDFIERLNDMDNIYENIEANNPNKENKILNVFDDLNADVLSYRNLTPIETELFIRGGRPNNSLFLHRKILFCRTEKY